MSLCGAGRLEPGHAWRMWCRLASLPAVEDLRRRLYLARLASASAKSMSAMTHICQVNLHAQLHFLAPGSENKVYSEKGGSHGVHWSVNLFKRGDLRRATTRNLGTTGESKEGAACHVQLLQFGSQTLQLIEIFAAQTHGCNLSWHGVFRAFPLTHMLSRCIHSVLQVTCTHQMTAGPNPKTTQTLLLDGFSKGSQESSQRCLGESMLKQC